MNESADFFLKYRETITAIIYRIVIPVELVVGLLCQCVNLLVLRSLHIPAYTSYLRTLSTIYLLLSPLLLFDIAEKLEYVKPCAFFVTAFITAHIIPYTINVLFVSANVLIVCIACEAVNSLVRPFHYATRPSYVTSVIIFGVFGFAAFVLSPLMFEEFVEENVENATLPYLIKSHNSTLTHTLRTIVASVLELWLLVLLTSMYLCIFIRHNHIVSQSRSLRRDTARIDVQQKQPRRRLTTSAISRQTAQSTPATSTCEAKLRSSKRAVITCSAPVGAYILSNLPSALKECVYLAAFCTGSDSLKEFIDSDFAKVYKVFANAAMVFNFTLYVILQYFARQQYRRAFNMDGKRVWVHLQHLTNSHGRHSVVDNSRLTTGAMSRQANGDEHSATIEPSSNGFSQKTRSKSTARMTRRLVDGSCGRTLTTTAEHENIAMPIRESISLNTTTLQFGLQQKP